MTRNAPLHARRRLLACGVAAITAGLSGCSPVVLLNTIELARDKPKVVRDIAFGPGPRHKLDVYQPAAPVSGAPVVVFIYGGSWSSGDKGIYDFLGAALAHQGFVCVIADYRLYPEVRYPDFLRDQAQAVRWTLDNIKAYGGDPQRLVLAGHSAGAYSAVMLGLDPRWLAEAGVSPAALRGVVGLAGPYDFYPFDVEASQNTFGAWPKPAETQPINFAHPGAPPMFLAAGDDDVTVKPSNTTKMAAKLRAAGNLVVEKHYPRVTHIHLILAMSYPFEGEAPVLADVVAFIRRVTA